LAKLTSNRFAPLLSAKVSTTRYSDAEQTYRFLEWCSLSAGGLHIPRWTRTTNVSSKYETFVHNPWPYAIGTNTTLSDMIEANVATLRVEGNTVDGTSPFVSEIVSNLQ